MLYWWIKLVFLGPILRILFRPWIEGEEHLPARGPAILASNHLSFSDSILLPLMCPRRITFPAKSDYFTQPGLVGRLKAAFFRGTGQIPIDRSGGAASRVAMDAGLAVLRRGELFGIYPEGTRSPDGRLYRGKTGIARLALAADVPVVPVAMIDTDKAQPTGRAIPRIMRVGVRVGPPLDFSAYAGREHDREVLREITDQIMAALADLSGQEYVDEYAATIKQQLAARAENLVATAKAEGAQAGARAQARAEEIVTAARTEIDQLRRKVDERRAESERTGQSTQDKRDDKREDTSGDTAEDAAQGSAENTAQNPRPDTPA